jgi:hypothetical protein
VTSVYRRGQISCLLPPCQTLFHRLSVGRIDGGPDGLLTLAIDRWIPRYCHLGRTWLSCRVFIVVAMVTAKETTRPWRWRWLRRLGDTLKEEWGEEEEGSIPEPSIGWSPSCSTKALVRRAFYLCSKGERGRKRARGVTKCL